MRYRVFLRGYIPVSAVAEVSAPNEEEAAEIAIRMAINDEVGFTEEDGVCDVEVAEMQAIGDG